VAQFLHSKIRGAMLVEVYGFPPRAKNAKDRTRNSIGGAEAAYLFARAVQAGRYCARFGLAAAMAW
jgi:hypothetical protein